MRTGRGGKCKNFEGSDTSRTKEMGMEQIGVPI